MGMIISIHASAKEATEIRARGPHSKKDFNPRLREGGDVLNLASAGAMSLISIHASAKEATEAEEKFHGPFLISIHASAKEATATYCDTSAIMYISSLNNFFVHYF